jgi:hypothetical protein
MSDWTETISVPTIKEESHQEIDLSGYSEGDLQVLRKQDPFMYHSIPTITLQAVGNVKTILTQSSSIVTRKSRVSTEIHPGLLMEDLFDDEGILNGCIEAFEYPDADFALLRRALNDRLCGGNVFGNEQLSEQ